MCGSAGVCAYVHLGLYRDACLFFFFCVHAHVPKTDVDVCVCTRGVGFGIIKRK